MKIDEIENLPSSTVKALTGRDAEDVERDEADVDLSYGTAKALEQNFRELLDNLPQRSAQLEELLRQKNSNDVECDACQTLMQRTAEVRLAIARTERLKQAMSDRSLNPIKTSATSEPMTPEAAGRVIDELKRILALLAMQLADCFDKCTPPDTNAAITFPFSYDYKSPAYPGEPSVC